jgi:hypothetical protein
VTGSDPPYPLVRSVGPAVVDGGGLSDVTPVPDPPASPEPAEPASPDPADPTDT